MYHYVYAIWTSSNKQEAELEITVNERADTNKSFSVTFDFSVFLEMSSSSPIHGFLFPQIFWGDLFNSARAWSWFYTSRQ